MNIGRLRHRVMLQSRTTIRNEEGFEDESWTDVATVWAAVEPLRGREYFAAAAVNAENTVRIRMRYRLGITPDMRLLYGMRIFEIQSMIDPDERHRELHLMCKEVASHGDDGSAGDAATTG
ncbi:SPP1 family predicted phage head-tail adaptor [Aneurinibacillus soli]|uniref:Phage head-tail joining protein n=1 Tax=Aneurinibacillus soli TaxID=1500254 RepID=A0A0U5BHI4_9BACL|nr:phage head closure protein [Aneurinibacillus soli]PYE63438.1 SPP1 family predicted phage head-tail adaptor [Aneurinibacillus soli]BAU27630.1 Phage head-tail joining protein [Aneurinibacillus soli]